MKLINHRFSAIEYTLIYKILNYSNFKIKMLLFANSIYDKQDLTSEFDKI